MNTFEIIVPTLFGMEALTAKEIRKLGYETSSVEDGRVTFIGDWEAVCLANIWIRTGERVLIKVGEFQATSFEELFEKTKAIRWCDWLSREVAFPVKGYSLKSKLASVPDCQAIIKKAIVSSLSDAYNLSWFEETGSLYQIQFSILKDKVTIMIDTSGAALHKRGYRREANAAPLRETIAAAMIMLSYWRYERPFADPCCGSGTIAIEAALIAQNIAPGLKRKFAAQAFNQISDDMWKDAKEEAISMQRNLKLDIFAGDIDANSIEVANKNAYFAGVSEFVKPKVADINNFYRDSEYGTVICNPPYGERLGEVKEAEKLYNIMGKQFEKLDKWSYYIITSDDQFEACFKKQANKKRKVYNGMLKCNIYQYFGPKPPKDTSFER